MANVNTPIAGVGSKIQRWSGSAYVDIAEVTSIGGPSASREMIDVTSLSTTGGYRKFIGSFRDSGAVNLALNFTNAGLVQMKTDFENSSPVGYQISLPDETGGALGTSVQFYGLVQELPLTIPTDAQITMDVVIKISGKFYVTNAPIATAPPTN
jgi:predicted secreted protein